MRNGHLPVYGQDLTGGFAPASNPYIANVLTTRFSEQGNLDWSKISGSATTIDVGNDISATPAGVYVTGNFGGEIAFGTHVLPGAHKLVVTPYTGPNGTGTAGRAYTVNFQVENGGFVQNGAERLAAEGPEPETEGASLTAAPNPFTDRATLRFTAPESDPARLEVYSSTGTRISLLFEAEVESGKKYEYAFDGTALPPGLYVGRLTTGGKVAHRKLLLGR